MRKALLILALLLPALPASAREVLVVQSVRSSLYDDALKGFRSACPADSSTLVLSDYADPGLARVLQEERPRLVVAVGDGALASLRKVRRGPLIAMMALGVRNQETNANLAGVELLVKPEQCLYLFKRLRTRRIGVIYDPARSGWYMKLARAAARQYGLELVAREARDPRQAIGQLPSLKGAVDALWVLPDLSCINRETLEAFFLFAQGQSIPAVSFSAAHLKLGAMVALEADRVELGRQGGELAQRLLRGAEPAELGISFPRKVSSSINEAVARRLRYSADLLGPSSSK